MKGVADCKWLSGYRCVVDVLQEGRFPVVDLQLDGRVERVDLELSDAREVLRDLTHFGRVHGDGTRESENIEEG